MEKVQKNIDVLDIPQFIQKRTQKRAQQREYTKLQNYIYRNLVKSQKAKKQRKINKIKNLISNIFLTTCFISLIVMFVSALVNKLFAFGYLRIM